MHTPKFSGPLVPNNQTGYQNIDREMFAKLSQVVQNPEASRESLKRVATQAKELPPVLHSYLNDSLREHPVSGNDWFFLETLNGQSLSIPLTEYHADVRDFFQTSAQEDGKKETTVTRTPRFSLEKASPSLPQTIQNRLSRFFNEQDGDNPFSLN